jgi:hypothetical protein
MGSMVAITAAADRQLVDQEAARARESAIAAGEPSALRGTAAEATAGAAATSTCPPIDGRPRHSSARLAVVHTSPPLAVHPEREHPPQRLPDHASRPPDPAVLPRRRTLQLP